MISSVSVASRGGTADARGDRTWALGTDENATTRVWNEATGTHDNFRPHIVGALGQDVGIGETAHGLWGGTTRWDGTWE